MSIIIIMILIHVLHVHVPEVTHVDVILDQYKLLVDIESYYTYMCISVYWNTSKIS